MNDARNELALLLDLLTVRTSAGFGVPSPNSLLDADRILSSGVLDTLRADAWDACAEAFGRPKEGRYTNPYRKDQS